MELVATPPLVTILESLQRLLLTHSCPNKNLYLVSLLPIKPKVINIQPNLKKHIKNIKD